LFNTTDDTIMKKARIFVKDLNQNYSKNGKE
jgi:hypothetical protein